VAVAFEFINDRCYYFLPLPTAITITDVL